MSDLMTKSKILSLYPLIYKKGRISVWQKAFGVLKNSRLNYGKELKKIREGWDRKIVS